MAVPNFTASHEYADMFPLDDGESLFKLSDQIKANGLRDGYLTAEEREAQPAN